MLITYPILLPWCTRYGYDVQTSTFFIGVILGTALIAQKCQALFDATKASCVISPVIVISCRNSFAIHGTQTFFLAFLIRLEERGWTVSAAPPSPSSRSEGGKASVVVVKTGKKKMDRERYLDATQRYVPSHLISHILFYSFSRARALL
jgi:hypothetical protein